MNQPDGKVSFAQVVAECHPALGEFAASIEAVRPGSISEPSALASDPERHVAAVDAFLATLDIGEASDADRFWLLARLAYLIGEWLRQRFGGDWWQDDIPVSPKRGRIVILISREYQRVVCDPFEKALSLFGPTRCAPLRPLLAELEQKMGRVLERDR